MSNLSNNISSLVNDKKVKEANIDLIERSKHVPLRLTLAERKLLRLCEAALGQTHVFTNCPNTKLRIFSQIFLSLKKKTNSNIGQKMQFFSQF